MAYPLQVMCHLDVIHEDGRLPSESWLLSASQGSHGFGVFSDLHVLMTLARRVYASVARGATTSPMLYLNRLKHACVVGFYCYDEMP